MPDEKNPFEYQKPTDDQITRITIIREKCKDLAAIIEACIPPSRERSIALNKLEEVSMWANKGVVFNPAPPLPDSFNVLQKDPEPLHATD